MSRLTPLTLESMSPEQRATAEAIIAGPRGGMRGPFEAWLRSPEMTEHAQRLGAYCRFQSSLSPALSELAILLTGKHWRAQFEFYAHARLAQQAGVPDGVIEAIRTGAPPPLRDDAERLVYDFVTEYFATQRVSEATYQRGVTVLGERGLVDLVAVVGYYGLVSMTLNVFDVGLPEGVSPPLE